MLRKEAKHRKEAIIQRSVGVLAAIGGLSNFRKGTTAKGTAGGVTVSSWELCMAAPEKVVLSMSQVLWHALEIPSL